MSIDRETAIALADLYRRRENLQRHRERARNRNVWLGFVERSKGGQAGSERVATESEQIIDALGGRGVMADMLFRATLDKFEELQVDIDKQISDLGGQP